MSCLENIFQGYFSADHKEFDRTSKIKVIGREGENYSSSVLSTSLFVSLRTLLTLSCLIFTFSSHNRTSYHQPSRISAALL